MNQLLGQPLPNGLVVDSPEANGTIPVGTDMTKHITVNWEWTYGNVATQSNYDENQINGINNSEVGTSYNIYVKIHGEQILPTN